MKVGELLNKEIEEIPSLKYTLKVQNSFKNKLSSQDKFESNIYLNNCNSFINSRKKPIIKSFSFSGNKSQMQPLNKIIKEIQNDSPIVLNQKHSGKITLFDHLPEITDQKSLVKKNLSSRKKTHSNLRTFPGTEINKNKEVVRKFESGRNLSISNFRNKILAPKSQKPFVDFDNDKKANIQKLFNLRIERKFKVINKITSKLNRPLFLLSYSDKNEFNAYN